MLEHLGRHADLALLWVTPGHAGALEDIGAAVRAVLAPTALLGVVAGAVLAGGEDTAGPAPGATAPRPGIALWAAQVGPVAAHLVGTPPPMAAAGAVVLADATAPPLPAGLAPVVAGGRSSRRGALVQDRVVHGAAVAALLSPAAGLRVVAGDGARPVGAAHLVTRASGELVVELDGRPALQVLLAEVADHVAASDLPLVDAGLRLRVTGRPLSAAVRGADRSTGALAADGGAAEGATVRFAVLDPAGAGAELAALVSGAGPASTALAWRSEERHRAWWAGAAGDAAVLGEVLGAAPVAGCATAREVAGTAAEAASSTVVALLGHG